MNSSVETKTFGIFLRPENRDAAQRIEAARNVVLNLPVAIDEPVELDAASRRLISDLESLDWLIFTDRFSVDNFMKRVRQMRGEDCYFDDICICAVGEATARGLRANFVHSDVITQTVDPASVFEAISDFARSIGETKILCLTGEPTAFIAPELIPSFARVREMPVYRLRFEEAADIPKTRALLIGGLVDALLVTSAREMESLKALIPGRPLADALRGVEVFAADHNSYQALCENGLRPRFFTGG